MSKGYKIRAIIKRPDERYGHVCNISDSEKNLKGIVDGRLKVTQITSEVVMIENLDAYVFDLPKNFSMGKWPFTNTVRGTVILLGLDDVNDEYVDCPLNFQIWKQLLRDWGNE